MQISSFFGMTKTHFRVTRRAADALGVILLDTLQHCVLIRTSKGPRFMGRSKFDEWEVSQRRERSLNCEITAKGTNTWYVEDLFTKSGSQTVTLTGAYSSGVEGRWQCTCMDSHFMVEHGLTPCCKHILAVKESLV
jgi:hypothetical protein